MYDFWHAFWLALFVVVVDMWFPMETRLVARTSWEEEGFENAVLDATLDSLALVVRLFKIGKDTSVVVVAVVVIVVEVVEVLVESAKLVTNRVVSIVTFRASSVMFPMVKTQSNKEKYAHVIEFVLIYLQSERISWNVHRMQTPIEIIAFLYDSYLKICVSLFLFRLLIL